MEVQNLRGVSVNIAGRKITALPRTSAVRLASP